MTLVMGKASCIAEAESITIAMTMMEIPPRFVSCSGYERRTNPGRNCARAYMRCCRIYVRNYHRLSCEVSLTGSSSSVTNVVSIYLLSNIPNKVTRGAFVSFYWAK